MALGDIGGFQSGDTRAWRTERRGDAASGTVRMEELERRALLSAPVLTSIDTLGQAAYAGRVPVTEIRYEDLLARSDAHDADGDPIGFRVTELLVPGSLSTPEARPVPVGSVLGPGEMWVFYGPFGQSFEPGQLPELGIISVVAQTPDGETSGQSVPVRARFNTSPHATAAEQTVVVSWPSPQPVTITYQQIISALGPSDVDNDVLRLVIRPQLHHPRVGAGGAIETVEVGTLRKGEFLLPEIPEGSEATDFFANVVWPGQSLVFTPSERVGSLVGGSQGGAGGEGYVLFTADVFDGVAYAGSASFTLKIVDNRLPTLAHTSIDLGALDARSRVDLDYAHLVQAIGAADPDGTPVRLTLATVSAGSVTIGGVPATPGMPIEPGQVLTYVAPPSAMTGTVFAVMVSDAHAPGGTATFRAAVAAPSAGVDGPFDVPTGARIDAAVASGGVLVSAWRNSAGEMIVSANIPPGPGMGTGAMWRTVDLNQRIGVPRLLLDPVAWTDPKDGLVYAAGATAQGVVVVTVRITPAGTVSATWRNLTEGLPGSEPIRERMTAFTSMVGRVYLAGVAADGDLVVYQQTGEGTSGAWQWTYTNLYESELRPRGEATPRFVAPLVSYVTAWDGLNIAGLTEDGKVWTVWTAPGMGQWASTNLSDVTGAPKLGGGLTVYLTAWGGINIVGASRDTGDVMVTWWVPGFGGEWKLTDFSGLYGGPRLRADSLTSYVTPWDALNVAGVDASGQTYVYWWEPSRSGDPERDVWTITPVGDQVFAPSTRLSAITNPTSAQISILGVTAEGAPVRAYWQPGHDDVWITQVI